MKGLRLVLMALMGATACTTPHPDGDRFDFSPYWDLKTIPTEHFRVHFDSELEDVARRCAVHLEEAHRILAPKMRWEPRQPVHVHVVDNSDNANGLAAAALRFGMVLKVTPPDSWYTINHYDDWLRFLIIHEYTHILNMDVTDDFMEALRLAFGDAVRPNTLWTPWMLEGLAVYMETRYTRAGRGRSSYYNMVLRAAVEEEALDSEEFVTLDRLDGNFPYYPGGATRYIFGYFMMNEVASDPILDAAGMTHDRRDRIENGEDALGLMSHRSGARVPYFINDHLELITGRDWYDYWESLTRRARELGSRQLETIRRQPLTPFRKLTQGGISALGSRLSPDGTVLAYTHGSPEHTRALFVRELESGATRRLVRKNGGVGLGFTPDSRYILFSEVRRVDNYYEFSDLAYYDRESEGRAWLTEGLRAKDPDVSPDGKHVVFTRGRPGSVGVAVAPLRKREGELALGKPRTLFRAELFDRAANPRFTSEGRHVVFSLHRNGRAGEEIVRVPLEGGDAQTLIADGSFNRFPAIGPDGGVYFVSDRSGADNLYRYRPDSPPHMLTNVTTGVWLPEVGRDSKGETRYFGSVFSIDGWDAAELEVSKSGLEAEALEIAPPPAPDPAGAAEPTGPAALAEKERALTVEDYSPFSSVFKPRQWAPKLLYTADQIEIGAQAGGFDAALRHSWLVSAYYGSFENAGSFGLQYSYRGLGPTLSLGVAHFTSGYGINTDGVTLFQRSLQGVANLSFPFRWTFSSLTPFVGFEWDRTFEFHPDVQDGPVSKFGLFPSAVAGYTWRYTDSSGLAVTHEKGRVQRASVRGFSDSGNLLARAYFEHHEYFHLGNHHVLTPAVTGAFATSPHSPAAVDVAGRVPRPFSGIPTSSSEELVMRGYPNRLFRARSATLGTLEYRFPLFNLFRGAGTVPVFLDRVRGFTFVDGLYFPGADLLLPSAGAGLRADLTLLSRVPALVSAEYHHGFRQAAGGRPQFVFTFDVSGLSF